jgi:uncharacterized protein HemX
MGMDPVTVGLVVAAVVGAGASMSESHQQRKAQRTQQRRQNQAIAKEKAEALETRKQQIGQLREQMNIGGFRTKSQAPVTSPVRGSIGETLG